MSGHRFDFLAEKLNRLRETQSLRTLRPYRHEGRFLIDADQTRLINFGSNDYLGFAQSTATVSEVKAGAGASALVSGYTRLHEELCRELASFEETEAAVLFPSGFAACSGTIATLAEDKDLLLSDQLNHASLIDGCRMSQATRFVYPHLEVNAVRELLRTHRHHHARAWIVTDGVFGMDGDVAPLNELCDIADRFDAHVVVDEAHATGVLGNDGSGTCAELGVKSRVPIRIGTLSKALGSHGGFVVGPELVINYLVNRCRSLIFSTAGSPLTISAALTHLRLIRQNPQPRSTVRSLANRLREQLREAQPTAVPPTSIGDVPIVPMIVGSNERALRMSDQLRKAGMYVPAIRPPTVPEGTARLRISLTANHTDADIEQLLQAMV
jgi:8-amino-7-oxononanoate synthase